MSAAEKPVNPTQGPVVEQPKLVHRVIPYIDKTSSGIVTTEVDIDDPDNRLAAFIRSEIKALRNKVANPSSISVTNTEHNGRKISQKRVNERREGLLSEYSFRLKVLTGELAQPIEFSLSEKGTFSYKIKPWS